MGAIVDLEFPTTTVITGNLKLIFSHARSSHALYSFSTLLATFITSPILSPNRLSFVHVCACFGKCKAILLCMRVDECSRLFKVTELVLGGELHGVLLRG